MYTYARTYIIEWQKYLQHTVSYDSVKLAIDSHFSLTAIKLKGNYGYSMECNKVSVKQNWNFNKISLTIFHFKFSLLNYMYILHLDFLKAWGFSSKKD